MEIVGVGDKSAVVWDIGREVRLLYEHVYVYCGLDMVSLSSTSFTSRIYAWLREVGCRRDNLFWIS